MAIAVDQNYDKAQRKISTANLEQFAGVDCQLLVEKETHRPIIMDGTTIGGKFKCASTDELKAVETVANNAISQAYADEHYLGKTDKAVSAGTADTAGSATKATQDASGNVITSTYATKTEVTSGLSGKLGKTEKASSASTADAVPWTGVSGKPNFATVATSGSYNDLKNKPTISSGVLTKIFENSIYIDKTGFITITNITPNKLLYIYLSGTSSFRNNPIIVLACYNTGIISTPNEHQPAYYGTTAVYYNIGSIYMLPVAGKFNFRKLASGCDVVLPSGTSISLQINLRTTLSPSEEIGDLTDGTVNVVAYQ